MIHETQVTLTQSELTTIQILCTEFLRNEERGVPCDLYRTEHTRQIWLRDCARLALKADTAMTHCLVTNEQTPINY